MVPAAFRIGVIGGGSWGTVLADLLAVRWMQKRHVRYRTEEVP
jgi:glycerol-3-phosphate dehydrogenase